MKKTNLLVITMLSTLLISGCDSSNHDDDSNIDPSNITLNLQEVDVPDLSDIKIYKAGNHYYSLIRKEKNLTWSTAEKECEEMGGHLASITSNKEDAVYFNILRLEGLDYVRCFLGARRDDNNGSFTKWITGEPISYSNWLSGEPNNPKKEQIIDYFKGKDRIAWNDGAENEVETKAYLCEWDDGASFGKAKPLWFYKLVSNKEELMNAIENNQNVILTEDVTLDSNFVAFNSFSGTFNGGGHTIKIPAKEIDADNPYSFVKTLTGTIENVTFDIDYSSPYIFERFGGVVYETKGIIRKVNTIGSINTPKASYIGGIFYKNDGGLIEYCTNGANITGKDYVAGISPIYMHGDVIESLVNTGNISGNDHVGGIGARYEWNWNGNRSSIVYSYNWNNLKNSGNINGNNYVGGLIGEFKAHVNDYSGSYPQSIKVTVDKAINTGNITGSDYVGGLFGYGYTDNNDSSINQANVSGTLSGVKYVGGIGGFLERIQVNNCSNDELSINALNNSTYVGGYAGRGFIINNVTNRANIEAVGDFIGGIVGYGRGSISYANNHGNITSEGNYIAGIAGFFEGVAGSAESATSITNCSNYGRIEGNEYVGGVIGQYTSTIQNEHNIKNVTNLGHVSGYDYVGGFVGSLYTKGVVYIDRCVSGSTVTAADEEAKYGAYFGSARSDNSSSYIRNCSNNTSTQKYGQLVNITDQDA